MSPNRTSMQSDSAFANANQSLETADHAVRQAESHPSGQMLTQAENALEKAQRAVDQAQRQKMDNPVAADRAASNLADVEGRLTDVER